MSASARPSSYHYVVDEPLLRTITAEIQAAIPGSYRLEVVATGQIHESANTTGFG